MNKLYKALICGGDISLSVLETKSLVGDAIKIHNLSDEAAETLGGLLSGVAYMAGCLKSERGAVSVTVKSNDGSATASVSGDYLGHIRGVIDGERLKGGIMTVIKEDGFFRPFTGTCSLKSDDVSENFMRYFQTSEQIDTAVLIDVKVKNGECTAAGGVVMQAMPGASEDSLKYAEEVMQSIAGDGCFPQGADEILAKYFPELSDRAGVYLSFPEYKCNCSRKKIESVIMSLGIDEARGIIAEQGKINVHCHYCNTDYDFDGEQIEKLFDNKQL